MRKLYIILFCIAFALPVDAQETAAQIRRDGRYIFAEADGMSARIADSTALELFAKAIADETDLPYTKEIKREILRTFIPDIRNVSTHIQSYTQSGSHSFRYIAREDLNKIFSIRKELVESLLTAADNALDQRKINTALRNCLWSATLLESISPIDVEKIASVRSKLSSITDKVKVSFAVKEVFSKKVVEVTFLYDGDKIRNVRYKFYDGVSWSTVRSAEEGIDYIELNGNAVSDLFRTTFAEGDDKLGHIATTVEQIEAAKSIKQVSEPKAKPAVKTVKTETAVQQKEPLQRKESIMPLKSSFSSVVCSTQPVEETINLHYPEVELTPQAVENEDNHSTSGRFFIDLSTRICPTFAVGAMAGWYSKFGFYAKFTIVPQSITPDYSCKSDGTVSGTESIWTTGKTMRTGFSASAGGIARITDFMAIYAGLGYGQSATFWEDCIGRWAKVTDLSYSGIDIDLGLIFTFWSHLSVNAGVGTTQFKDLCFDLGVGYAF